MEFFGLESHYCPGACSIALPLPHKFDFVGLIHFRNDDELIWYTRNQDDLHSVFFPQSWAMQAAWAASFKSPWLCMGIEFPRLEVPKCPRFQKSHSPNSACSLIRESCGSELYVLVQRQWVWKGSTDHTSKTNYISSSLISARAFLQTWMCFGHWPGGQETFSRKNFKSFSFPINQLGLIYDLVSFGPILEKPKPNIIDA